ncbi:MAG: alpha/beta hydrolase [Proteobacteria bacterium]|nr:alpha/beta hydrolase [Pseudomonadota bacterium]
MSVRRAFPIALPFPFTIRLGARSFRALGDRTKTETGIPALFVHATSFCADTWAPVIGAARDAGWRGASTAVDQRGHGRSDPVREARDCEWPRLVGDVAGLAQEVAREAGAETLLLVGHSSGASVCLAAAGQRPELVRGLVLVEPTLFDPPAVQGGDSFLGSGALAASARRRRSRFADRAEASECLRKRFPYSGFAPESFEAYLDGGLIAGPDADGGLSLACTPDCEAWMYEGAGSLDVWPLSEKVRAPILLVLGEHTAVPRAMRDRVEAGAAPVRIETIAGGTHFTALESPAAVGRALARFALSLERAP